MGGLIDGMVGRIFGMWAGAPDLLYHGLAFGLALGLTLGLVSGLFRAGAAPSLLFTEVAPWREGEECGSCRCLKLPSEASPATGRG